MSLAQKLKAKLNPTNNAQKGFTLIELLVVLVVIAVLTLVGMAVKPKVMDMVSSYQVTSAVDTISSESLSWKGAKANFDGISIASMCTSGDLSKNICGGTGSTIGDGTKANPFGGNYAVAVNGTDSNLIDLTITNVPSSIGTKLVSNLQGHSVNNSAKYTGGTPGAAGKPATAGSITLTI